MSASGSGEGAMGKKWWEEYYLSGAQQNGSGEVDRVELLAEQRRGWEWLSSRRPGRVRPPGLTLSVLVRDPRLTLPRKRDGIKEDILGDF